MKRREDDEQGWAVPGDPAPHPVLRALAGLDGAVSEVSAVSLTGLGESDAGEALLRVTALEARVAALRTALTARAETVGVGSASGAPSAAVWLALRSGLTPAEARRRSNLARALDRHPRLAAVFGQGLVSEAQVAAVLRALQALPAGLETWVHDSAADLMVRAALDTRDQSSADGVQGQAALDAAGLKRLGEELLTRVAPEVGEAHEARRLAEQDRHAWDTAHLQLRHDGQGSTWGTFRIPVAQGEQLEKVLTAIASPEHQRATQSTTEGTDQDPAQASEAFWRRPYRLRLGQAFAELIDRLPVEDLPRAGGVAARVVVTMTLADLLGTAKAATLDTGTRISAGEARRLVCEAGLVPAVLGGPSEVLDLGRTRRLHTAKQRLALALRDGGCTVEGCTAPPAHCHTHHDTPWAAGGATTLANARLLCPFHHRRVHDPGYTVQQAGAGRLHLHRRE
ncbi:HNH endonuclease signature motif containing protein [Nocardioides sp. GY 10127]|uniref:HNH endonuclease signature motif containing protein n=1 Tax=Nocardioides sp. GY 10127 TaxID=2569762 RepID=UPI0014584043|nr:HNH endonuclease signature motif containing protein [Nocardioides sp. GY 10127]